jgi:CRISPR-associated protein Cmr6
MSANLGYLFYKEYFDAIKDYRAIDAGVVASQVDTLISTNVTIEECPEEYMGNRHFKATTTYPGLLLGIGNIHELPSVDGQAILGFHFDYTTGLPVIPGSSIKGVLRSAFGHHGYIKELLAEIMDDTATPETLDLNKVEEEIFGQKAGEDRTQKGTDVFFDAPIISAHGGVLADDYLAPHGDIPTQEPNVLRFIKVAPGVTFRFDFGLSDQSMSLTPTQRFELYRAILEDFGLGAKTNVGYGYFTDFHTVTTEAEKEAIKEKEMAQLCQEMSQSHDADKLKGFIQRYSNAPCIEEVKKRLEEIKGQEEIRKIREKWDKVDKTKKDHVQSFYQKHKDDTGIDTLLEEVRVHLSSDDVEVGAEDIKELYEITSLKKMQGKLKKKKASLSELEQENLYRHIVEKCKLDIKKNKYSFSIFKDLLGDVRGQAIGDKLSK